MAVLRDLVVDCRHPASLARFWAAALDGYRVAPYDEAERARLAAAGIDSPEDDPTVLVEGPQGMPRLLFQAVAEPKVVKNRVHLDLAGPIRPLLHAGAIVLRERDDRTGLVLLADPEGNEFCVVDHPG